MKSKIVEEKIDNERELQGFMHVRWSEKRKPKGKKDQKIINDIF